jgi:Ca2+-binding EF-hand superfamily protein
MLFDRFIPFAGLVMLGAAVPALTAAQPAKPAAKPPVAAQQPAQTRANFIKALDANFKGVDTNGDGALSAAELAVAEGKGQQRLIAQYHTAAEADFAKIDTNKDGALSKAEFVAAVTPRPSSATPNGPALVTELDKNNDGKVGVEEFRAPRLAQFDAIDTNHDGTLSQAERKAVQAKRKR